MRRWTFSGCIKTVFPCQGTTEGMPTKNQPELVYAADGQQPKQGSRVEEEIKRKLYLLHAATGHGSKRHLIEALRRRNVDPLVLRLAENFECPICAERKKVQPRQLASLEPLPPKFHTVVVDIGHWRCPSSGEQQNFMLAIDEGSRFRTAKILTKGAKQTPNSAACLKLPRRELDSSIWQAKDSSPGPRRVLPFHGGGKLLRSTRHLHGCDPRRGALADRHS